MFRKNIIVIIIRDNPLKNFPQIKVEKVQIFPNFFFLLEELKVNAGSLDETSGVGHLDFLFEKKFENVWRVTHFHVHVRMKNIDIFCGKEYRTL